MIFADPVAAKKSLRIQMYPDTYGRSLSSCKEARKNQRLNEPCDYAALLYYLSRAIKLPGRRSTACSFCSACVARVRRNVMGRISYSPHWSFGC